MTLPRPDATSVVVLVVFVIAIFAATPVGRATVIEGGVQLERLLGLGPWPAYHGRLITETDGGRREELMIWDGASPARAVFAAPPTEWRGGWWSEDRAAIAFGAGPSIYVGDRSGQLREVANVAPLWLMSVNWVGDRIFGLARDTEQADWLIRVDVARGGVTTSRLPEGASTAKGLGLLNRIDTGAVPPTRKFSQDGRWLITADLPCRSVAVHEFNADRRVELADGVGQRGLALGWLRGSVLVWGICDRDRGIMKIRAGVPNAAPTEIGTVPLPGLEHQEWIGVIIDEARDRILFTTRDGPEWLVVALDLSGQQVEVARIGVPIESELGEVLLESVSRDGRLIAFSAVEVANVGYAGTLVPIGRAGVFDTVTGRITWACDVPGPPRPVALSGQAYCGKIRLR